MKKQLNILCTSAFLLLISAQQVLAQATIPLENNPKYVQNGVVTIQAIEGIIKNILIIAITGIGFAGFVMMIIGSFQYMLAGSDSKGVETGKNTITYSIIGLVVALSSWIILNLIAVFTGVESIKIFNICFGGTC